MRFIEITIERTSYVEPFDDYIGSSVCYDTRKYIIRFKNREITWSFGNSDKYPYITPEMLTREIIKLSQKDDFILSVDITPDRNQEDQAVKVFRSEE